MIHGISKETHLHLVEPDRRGLEAEVTAATDLPRVDSDAGPDLE